MKKDHSNCKCILLMLNRKYIFKQIILNYSTKSYIIAFDLLMLWMLLPSNFKDENIC